MPNAKKKFTRADFLHAWLKAKEHEDSHEDLCSYHSKVYSAFSQAFKVDLNHLPAAFHGVAEDRHLGIVFRFFQSVAKNRSSFSSPFSGVLAAPKYISDLSWVYGDQFLVIQEESEKLHNKLLLELMDKIWGIADNHTVTQEDLNQHGYPSEPEPDDSDYW